MATTFLKRITGLTLATVVAGGLLAPTFEQAYALPAPLATATVLTPQNPGSTTYSSSGAELDASNLSEGYIMARYTGGSSSRLKLRITKSGGTIYNYDLNTSGNWEVFPFTEGGGSYSVQIYQNVSGSSYAQLLSQTVSVSLRSETLPFLYPSQYVNFNDNSQAVKKADELAKTKQLDTVAAVYDYVIKNIAYDYNKAQTVTSGYLPTVDNVLSTGQGICFDYAALMCAMLRSQGIPSKLVVGYAGKTYHAWINTYIADVGWVDGIIYFDGTSWKLMDPTFASTGGKGANSFIGDGSNYSKVYVY